MFLHKTRFPKLVIAVVTVVVIVVGVLARSARAFNSRSPCEYALAGCVDADRQ
jgi:hypothetical protein